MHGFAITKPKIDIFFESWGNSLREDLSHELVQFHGHGFEIERNAADRDLRADDAVGSPAQAPLRKIFEDARREGKGFDHVLAQEIRVVMEGFLYADQPADPTELRKKIAQLLFAKSRSAQRSEKPAHHPMDMARLPELNPDSG